MYQAEKKKQSKKLIAPCAVAGVLIGLGLWQFFGNVGGCRGPNYWGEYWSLTAFMFDPFSFSPGLMIDVGLILIVCALIWFMRVSSIAKNKYEAQNAQEKKEQAAQNGTWEFPVKEFYAKCKEQGITDSDTAFTRKKIENVAKTLMLEKGIPETAQGVYIKKAVNYFNTESNRIINETASEEKRWKTTLHTASPSDGSYRQMEKAEKVKNMYGAQKREYLLRSELESTQSLLGYSEGKHFKPILQKEKDWAVHGGIAQGIAGPAAGAVTAMNVMRENEKIREQNAQMMRVSAIVNQQRYADEARYRKEIKELEEELRVLPEKVILDNISTEEILSAFQISVKEISRHKERSEGCMNVLLSIRQTRSLHLDIPADAKIVLDGSICGKVFTAKKQPNSECPGGVEVGEFIASIDMYGIPYHNEIRDGITLEARSVQGYCSRFYGDINTKYVCKLTGKPNLWLMER